MEKYTTEITELSKMSDKVGGKMNRSMRKHIVPKLNKSGFDFLARIHDECKGQIGATQEELDEEQEILREQNTTTSVQKPELTVEYLRSIGRDDMTSW